MSGYRLGENCLTNHSCNISAYVAFSPPFYFQGLQTCLVASLSRYICILSFCKTQCQSHGIMFLQFCHETPYPLVSSRKCRTQHLISINGDILSSHKITAQESWLAYVGQVEGIVLNENEFAAFGNLTKDSYLQWVSMVPSFQIILHFLMH